MASIHIKTAQNVEIEHELADLGIRIVGILIDKVVIFAYIGILIGGILAVEDTFDHKEEVAFTIIFILLMPVLLYSPILCSITQGQTIGKMAVGTRVIKLNGNNAHFGHYFLRWLLLWILDMSIIGVILIATTDLSQRVGDMLAGTVVIKTKSKVNSISQQKIESSYVPKYDKVTLLSQEDVRAIKEIIDTNRSLPNPELVQRTSTKLKAILQVQHTDLEDIDFLQQVLRDYHFLVK